MRLKPGRPNVLWIMSDEQRTDSVGCYGRPWAHTPNLDRLAFEGTRFECAVTPAPVCAPARAALTTGQYPHETGVWWNIPSADYPVLPHLTEMFHQAGYRSASIGKRHYSARNDAFQYESSFELSPDVDYYHYTPPAKAEDFDAVIYPDGPYPWILGGRFPSSTERTSEARVVREAQAWLEAHDAAAPFLLRLSFNAPHTPVVPPGPFDTVIAGDGVRLPVASESAPCGEPEWIAVSLRFAAEASRLSLAQVAKIRRYYYGEVAFLDNQVGVMLDWMRGRGMLDNTIVVFVSDHGAHVGDYGLVQKQTFYEPVVNVPYLFWFPRGVQAGGVIRTPVETRSLLPTLLALAGLPVPEGFRDSNLASSLCRGNEPPGKPVFSEFTLGSFGMRPEDRLIMVRDGDWKLSLCVARNCGEGALYNLAQDRYERHNLYGAGEAATERKRLTGLIMAHVAGSR